jgi:5S rRNA maturation endonuclease (ribonuclease M5)
MKTEDYKELKRLERLVDKLDRDLDSVIVEGYADKKAMKKLGFTGKIFLSAERTIEDLVEDVARGSDRTAVLTDFDAHGKEQYRKISHELQGKVKNSISSREAFGKQLTSRGRHAVEDVRPLFEDKNQKFVEAALSRLYTFE